MKKILLLFFSLTVCIGLYGQVILDFETEETSTNFQYFGSSIDGQLSEILLNPNPGGVNVSDSVMQHIKPAGSETWAGAYTNPQPSQVIDAISNAHICIDVHMDHIGTVSAKLEQSDTGGDNWLLTIPNTKINEWEQVCFDFSLPGEEAPNTAAKGHTYKNFVIFFDFGVSPESDVVSYFDNVIVMPEEVETVIYDFEDDGVSTNFTYFGSSIDGTSTSPIDNPNPTGVNTSMKVLPLVKPVGAMTWAGAYANPAPNEAIDAVNGSRICVDVHYDHIGNLAVKLEQSSTGGEDWTLTVPNTAVNEWEQLCFDLSLPGEEGTNQPAKGHLYNQIVLFTDFGMEVAETNDTSFVDNIIMVSEGGVQTNEVTFQVDMNQYEGDFMTVNLIGQFNDWSADANPMSDENEDGIWETTVTLENGTYEYKFLLDGTVEETFSGTESCVAVSFGADGEVFANRKVSVAGEDTVLDPVCWSSCYECGNSISITFNLGVPEPAEGGVYLAGGAEFGAPGGIYQMTDGDGDGVYSITIERESGWAGYYTFANGNCPDYSCKEDIAGQDCARPENFNDRFLDTVRMDTVINTCFGQCTTDTNCGDGPDKIMVTFAVDMNQEEVSAEGVRIAGQFSNWGDVDMADDDADGIYTVTLELAKGTFEYKFKNGPDGWEDFEPGGTCTVTTEDGQFTNRVIDLSEAEDGFVVEAVCFNSCDMCTSSFDEIDIDEMFTIFPTETSQMLFIEISNDMDVQSLQITSMDGKVQRLINNTVASGMNSIDVTELTPGVYILTVTSDQSRASKKFIKL